MFRITQGRDDFLRVVCVRAIVFMGEQACTYAEEIDGLDEEAIHILGELNGEPIAAGRVRLAGKTARLERLAIVQSYRGCGYGSQLLEYMSKVAVDRGAEKLLLHAQVAAINFYEKHGFYTSGPVFQEAGIAHQLMSRSVPN